MLILKAHAKINKQVINANSAKITVKDENASKTRSTIMRK